MTTSNPVPHPSPPGPTLLLAPGNYCSDPAAAIWYPSVTTRLGSARSLGSDGPLFPGGVVLQQFPDWRLGQESLWLPFIETKLGEGGVLIGHSTGAVAGMRYAEKHRLKGLVLVAAYHSDLGDKTEKKSGYFSRPWDWSSISQNCGWIIQFASPDDPLVPIKEQRYVAEHIGSHYVELEGHGHFNSQEKFPELGDAVLEWMQGVE